MVNFSSKMTILSFCAKSTSMDFSKVNEENNALHIDYSKFMMEWDEVIWKKTRLQHAMHEVYNNFLDVPMEVYAPLEEKVTNIREAI
jgi:hypothetical protein